LKCLGLGLFDFSLGFLVSMVGMDPKQYFCGDIVEEVKVSKYLGCKFHCGEITGDRR
jgi:hypothetical protein